MEIKPNPYLESAEWVDRIERELTGTNSPDETRLLADELIRSTELAEAIDVIRLGRRAMANEMMKLNARLAIESGQKPVSSAVPPPVNWRKPVVQSPALIRRRINRLVFLGVAGLLIAVAGLFYVSTRDDRPAYISLRTPADSVLVRQLFDEQFVDSYLVAQTKGAGEDQLGRARQLILSNPAATDSVLTLLADVKDDATYEVNFLRGYVLLQDARKRPAGAIAALQRASRSSDARIQDEARWYLALAYLKNMNLDRAYPLFKQLAASSLGHRRYAQEVVDALTRH